MVARVPAGNLILAGVGQLAVVAQLKLNYVLASACTSSWPAAEVGAQCLLEKSGGLLVVGEQCAGVPQTQRDPDSRVVPSARFDLRHARSCLIDAANMQGGLGKVSDDPGGNRRMMRRVGGVEETLSGLVGVSVAGGSERSRDSSALRQGDHVVGARGRCDPLGFRRRLLGRVFVTAH